jgi:hypothetical protein
VCGSKERPHDSQPSAYDSGPYRDHELAVHRTGPFQRLHLRRLELAGERSQAPADSLQIPLQAAHLDPQLTDGRHRYGQRVNLPLQVVQASVVP